MSTKCLHCASTRDLHQCSKCKESIYCSSCLPTIGANHLLICGKRSREESDEEEDSFSDERSGSEEEEEEYEQNQLALQWEDKPWQERSLFPPKEYWFK